MGIAEMSVDVKGLAVDKLLVICKVIHNLFDSPHVDVDVLGFYPQSTNKLSTAGRA